MASRKCFFVPFSHHICSCGSGSNQLLLFRVRVYYAFVQLLTVPVNASQFAFGMVPSLFLVSPLRGCHRQKTLKAAEMFCSPYGGFCLQMCVLCWLGSVPSFSPCPCRPPKRCHHRIAGNRCLGTSSWLCPSKQTVISSKSSEVSPLVVD